MPRYLYDESDGDHDYAGWSLKDVTDEVAALRAKVAQLEERERQLEATLGWGTPNAIRYRAEHPDLYPVENGEGDD